MKSDSKIYEHYVYETHGKFKIEADLFEYSINLVDGQRQVELQKWSVWSAFTNNWQEQSLRHLEITWPSKYEKICTELQEIISDEDFELKEFEPEEAS